MTATPVGGAIDKSKIMTGRDIPASQFLTLDMHRERNGGRADGGSGFFYALGQYFTDALEICDFLQQSQHCGDMTPQRVISRPGLWCEELRFRIDP